MNIASEKLDIIQWISGINDKIILEQLKKIKDSYSTKKQDWWETLSIEEKQSIERGLEDAKNGKVTPHSEVRKKYEKWL
jgi:predicted transcriptional regulator